MFLSTHGTVIGRIEGWHGRTHHPATGAATAHRTDLAAQDVRDTRIGAGLSDAEMGLRLRYEIAREFAPYIGVSYEAKTGRTADLARATGRSAAATNLVIGARFWF